jgi:FtsZ-binding cell division protein ZapB
MTVAQVKEIKLLNEKIEDYKEVVKNMNKTIDDLVIVRDKFRDELISLKEQNGKLQDNIRSYNMLKAQYDDIKPKYDKVRNFEYDIKVLGDQYTQSCKIRANIELENISLKNSLRKLKDAYVYNHFRLEDELVHIVTMEKNHFNNIAKKHNISIYRMNRFTDGETKVATAKE